MNAVINWAKAHPRLTAWIVLGLGMDGMVAYEARDVGLQVTQWIALIAATTLVAGLCVWIIGWEDDEDEVQPSSGVAAPAKAAGATAAPAPKASSARPARKPAAKKAAAKKPAAKKTRK